MASAALAAEHRSKAPTTPAPTALTTLTTLPKKPLPAGRPREWYVSHNRRLKAMRLAIALLDTGVHRPEQASDRRIRTTAEQIGVRPPSRATCGMVRSLIRHGDR
ncbi:MULTISPECIES: hypothetical protein [Streptomyces]|jgi:hypothetical protein|uniref:Uncharacterized protein n=1 Tax=Streptomyces radiopugnans TaxID=403935 RepID=A0A1H9FTY5_9ACTN|nr:hypothetical protein [Streptomyces radiopugnans]SEQ41374.1 hypothetical protein SAMN05216481_107187 [Streptomyces radiopugnans]